MTEAAVRPTLADAVIKTLEGGEVTSPLGRDIILLITDFIVMRSVPTQEERKKLRAAYEGLTRNAAKHWRSLPPEPSKELPVAQDTMEGLIRAMEGALALIDMLDRGDSEPAKADKDGPDSTPST